MPGYIIYQGPSLIDGKQIVVIYLTGSDNVKTGNMAQTHILRADIAPITASRNGDDYSICGDCKHRGTPNPNKSTGWADKRSCYVNLIHGPNQVYKAFKAGKYPIITDYNQIKILGKNQNIRIGSYGDPLAVPSGVWSNLISESFTWTGYTHQAFNKSDSETINMCMVSVDNKDEYNQAQSKGFRTFRIIPYSEYKEFGHNSLMQNEILCPASKESNKENITCFNCSLCKGQTIKGKSIAIVAHGMGKKHIT